MRADAGEPGRPGCCWQRKAGSCLVPGSSCSRRQGRPPEARRVCKQVPLRLRASITLCRRQPPGSASAACCARPSLHALYVHTCFVQLLLGGCLLPIKGCLSVGESQAATYAHLPAGKSAQGASTEHAALAALPADSAMKALVEHLAGSSSAAGTSPWPSALLTSIL